MAHTGIGSQQPTEREPTPIPWATIGLLGLGIVAAISTAIIVVLGPEELNSDKQLRLDALKVVLTGLAGYGAAVTVWLSLRRQQHFERHSWSQRELDLRRQARADLDNRERRTLELYSAATDQLASEQAAVRLAGLYSFERLAAENEPYRQTVVDVFCTYLRMNRSFAYETDRLSEDEVRKTVQSLLIRHLRPSESPDSVWQHIHVDLARANLRDFDATGAHFAKANFEGANFVGETVFNRAKFTRKGQFRHCHFKGSSSFRRARFDAGASFEAASFEGQEAAFTGAHFQGGSTSFRQCAFATKQSIFRGARFASEKATNFNQVSFEGHTSFKRAVFTSRITTFPRAEFPDGAEPFMGAKFTSPVLVEDIDRWNKLLRGAHVLSGLDEAAPTPGLTGDVFDTEDTTGADPT